jgi:subtilisin family serine protease
MRQRSKFERWRSAILLIAILIAVLPARTQDKTGATPKGSLKPPAHGAGSSTRRRITEQSANSFDAGDFYLAPAGKRSLRRVAGSIVVRFAGQTKKADLLNELTAAGGPLAGYTLDFEAGQGFTVLAATAAERQRQLRDPAAHQQAIAAARRAGGVRSANPFFVEPASGLGLVVTEEIIIRLRPNVDPRNYFGADWANARPMRGTTDQFILQLAGADAETILAETNRRAADPRVAWAQPNFLSQVLKQTNDPLFPNQWHLDNRGINGSLANADVTAPQAWAYTTGSSNIVIAIIDDGTQLDHPDLSANIFSNPGETLNGLDDDNNGYVDDLHGWDFFSGDNDPSPEFPEDVHGTATAGVAAAVGNNGLDVASIAYNCRVMPVKVIGGQFFAPDSTIAEAIYYAAGRTRDGLGTWRGADILSISLSFDPVAVIDDALSWAATNGRGGKGCPIFAAAGNAASRWLATRVRLDLASVPAVGPPIGPGIFRFGFEYRKDDSLTNGEDLVKIDNVALLAADGVTDLDSPLGPNGRQDFEGPFPPSGWQLASLSGTAFWSLTTTGALAGTGGSRSARSGPIGDSDWTELQTPLLDLNGDEILTFACYLSCEPGYDGLNIWVYDDMDNIVTYYGDPFGTPLLSGNDDINTLIVYPASNTNTIAVGASTDRDLRSDYSQFGPGLDLVAPSSGGWSEIVTTDRTGTNGYSDADFIVDFGGTSAACPLAAGVGALALSADPALRAADLRDLLHRSCDRIGGVTYDATGWNMFYGYGRINAQRAVSNAVALAAYKITSASVRDTDVLLSFTTIAGRSNSVEQASGVGGANVWTAVPDLANVPGTGGIVTVTNVGGAVQAERFYRLRLLP